MSQSELARRAGVHHTLVSRLESGARSPSRKVVARLIRVLAGDDSELAARLLAAAGYAPFAIAGQSGVREVWELLALLNNQRLADSARRFALSVIAGVNHALREELDQSMVLPNGSVADKSEGGPE
jgi:transcriptional regulator with XRE-family HTH domain